MWFRSLARNAKGRRPHMDFGKGEQRNFGNKVSKTSIFSVVMQHEHTYLGGCC